MEDVHRTNEAASRVHTPASEDVQATEKENLAVDVPTVPFPVVNVEEVRNRQNTDGSGTRISTQRNATEEIPIDLDEYSSSSDDEPESPWPYYFFDDENDPEVGNVGVRMEEVHRPNVAVQMEEIHRKRSLSSPRAAADRQSSGHGCVRSTPMSSSSKIGGRESNEGGEPAHDYATSIIGEEISSTEHSHQSYSPQNAHHSPSPLLGYEAEENDDMDIEETPMEKTDNRDKPTHSVSKKACSIDAINRKMSRGGDERRLGSASLSIKNKNKKRPRESDNDDDVSGSSVGRKKHKSNPSPRNKMISARNETGISSRTRLRSGALNVGAAQVNHDDPKDFNMEVCHDSNDNMGLECGGNQEEDNGNIQLSDNASGKDDEASEPVPQENMAEESIVSGDASIAAEESAKQGSKGRYDIRRLLVEYFLGRGSSVGVEAIDKLLNLEQENQNENNQGALITTTLPLKFRFEDEVPKEVEKTDHEKEMEGLFSELDNDWALSKLKAFNYHDTEVGEEAAHPIVETQYDRCRRGCHVLALRDEAGLICRYCNHVELGPRDVMPQWANKIHRGSERKRQHGTEDVPEIKGANVIRPLPTVAAAHPDYNTIEGTTVWSIKAGVRETMYEHQQEGFEFLWKNIAGSINLQDLKSNNDANDNVGGCIISHAPGTGKTRLTIVFIETYLKMFPKCRPLIIAPASMLLIWEEEFRKWNTEFPFINLNSTDTSALEKEITSKLLAGFGGAKRQNLETMRLVKLYAWDTGRSILGISYSLFEKLTWQKKACRKKTSGGGDYDRVEALREILFERPGLVVLDEGHTPRNERSNIWNVLIKLQTEKRVILSGTPFQNNFCELFNTLRIVRPNVADSLAQEKTFCGMITSRGKRRGDYDDEAVKRLKAAMVPFVHVHKGTILQKNLPGLEDCAILLKPSPLQKSLIERLEGSPSTFEFEHKVALLSVHPHLYQHNDPAELGPEVARSVAASRLRPDEGCKTRFIVALIRLSSKVDEKVLIFSQYIQPLELIKEQLKEIFKWSEGREILQLQGSLEQKQRQTLINVFNDPNSDSKVMLASTKCCSEGISLVGASRVVLLDVLWNPSVERQAICRAYRIGQKKVVYTYHLMTLGTTEADKYCRQAEKERLSELVFTSSSNEGNREKHASSSAASACIEDSFLEQMVGHPTCNGMFEKIINQPKDANLIETFGLTS